MAKMLRTAVVVVAASVPLTQTSRAEARDFGRGGFHPQFRGNFHPQFRPQFHPQFHDNFHPQFRPQFHPQFHYDFRPQFRDFDRFNNGFRFRINTYNPYFGLNYGYNYYQPPYISQPYNYNYQYYGNAYQYSTPPVYIYPAPTYQYQPVYVPQVSPYINTVPADPPATTQTYVSNPPTITTYGGYANSSDNFSNIRVITYPSLQILFPGGTTFADIQNMYLSGKISRSEEQEVISDMHLKPPVAPVSDKRVISKDDIASAKRLFKDGYITKEQFDQIIVKDTLESNASKLYSMGAITKAQYEKAMEKIKAMPTNGKNTH
jgi:hypothetical protein